MMREPVSHVADKGQETRLCDITGSRLSPSTLTDHVLTGTSLSHPRKKYRSALNLFPNDWLLETKGQVGMDTSSAVTWASGANNRLALRGDTRSSCRAWETNPRRQTTEWQPAAFPFLPTHHTPAGHVRGDVRATVQRRCSKSPGHTPTNSALLPQLPASAKAAAFKHLAGSSYRGFREAL